MEDPDARAKAEQLNLQAEFRYIKIQSHIKVYGSRDAEMEQEARNGIEFVEAALKLVPDSAKYLNTYALLLADGLGQKKLALEILARAAQLAPDDIQLKQNIRGLQAPSQGCLVVCFVGVVALTFGCVFARICFG
jgi:tetratricopeptide (TPR) repeat protein